MSDQLAVDALQAFLVQNPELTSTAAGWKVALNFRAAQQRLGLTRALAVPLRSLQTYSSGQPISVASDRRIHVEAELALKLAADVRASSDPLVVESVRPCLELVDYALPRTDLATMFAHTFFHAGVVLGPERPLAQLAPFAAGLPRARNGATHERLPDTVPEDILEALAQLAQRALEAGASLRRGQLVLCGSYIEPIALEPGQRIDVDYGSDLGTLSIAR